MDITPPLLQTHHIRKIKPLFLAKTKWRCFIASDVNNINKYKPKMLKTLEITHINDEKINHFHARQLRRALTDAKKITSLAIQKDDLQRTYQTTNHLGYLLSSSNCFKRLSFRYNDKTMSKILNENTIKSLTRLGRCKNLSSLHTHFSCHEQTKNRVINHLSSQLRRLPELQSLSFDINNCSSYTYRGATAHYDPNAPLLKFKYPQGLSSLSLNFEGATSVKQELLPIFISNLQKCSKLKSLNLNSYGVFAGSDLSKLIIWAPLLKNSEKSLQALSLKQHFSEKNLIPFLDDFSHLKNLTSLDLDIISHLSVDQFQIFAETLYSHLALFPNLTSLILRVSSVKGLDSELQFIFPGLEYLTQLQQLEIGLPSTVELNNFHFQDLCQSLKHLSGLKKLVLDFPSKGISLENIFVLAYTLKNLTSLQVLSLKFNQASISFKGLEVMLKCLSNLPLKNLNLHLGQACWNPSNLSKGKPQEVDLFSGLSSGFNCLRTLNMNISSLKIPSTEVKNTFLYFPKLPQLSSLQMSLPEFSSFSLRKMPMLSSLSISLAGKSTDFQVNYLVRIFNDYRYLRSLNLYFGGAGELTDISLLRLAAGVRNLRKLKELQLVFSRVTGFSNESVFRFLASLSSLKGLQSLSFRDTPSNIPNSKLLGFARSLIEEQHKFKRLTNCVINYRVI